MQKPTQLIDRMDGGVTTKTSTTDTRKSTALKHFDALTQTDRLVPHRRLKADTFNAGLSTSADDSRLVKFLTYGTTQAGTLQWGMGLNGGSGVALKYRNLATSPIQEWLNDSATTGVLNENLFIQYRGKAYLAISGNAIVAYTLDTTVPVSSSVNNPDHSLTYTSIFQGIVHSKDDRLYIPYLTSSGAFLLSYNGSSWVDAALTLPTFVGKIDICERGDDIAVGVQPKYLGDHSYVYIWDRDSSLETTKAKVDWGVENLELVAELDGVLFGISTVNANTSIGFSDSAYVFFKYWDGASTSAKILFSLKCDDRTIQISQKQIINNRLYFCMSVKINGSWHEGVWSLGKNSEGQFVLSLEYQINNDTQVTALTFKGFQILGDYLTVAYTDNGTYTLKVTDDSATYSDTSIYESLVFNDGDSDRTKKLEIVTAMFDALPAAGSVKMLYKKDAETSFTTIFTHTTDNSISHDAINTEGDGVTLPEYKEIVFRLESTGGAVLTAFKYRSKIIDKTLS